MKHKDKKLTQIEELIAVAGRALADLDALSILLSLAPETQHIESRIPIQLVRNIKNELEGIKGEQP